MRGNDRTWAAETQLVEEELNQTPRSVTHFLKYFLKFVGSLSLSGMNQDCLCVSEFLVIHQNE